MMGAKNIAYALCALLVGYLLIGVVPDQVSQFATPRIAEKTDGQSGESQEILGAENDTRAQASGTENYSVEYSDEFDGDKRAFQIKTETILFWFADFLVAIGIYFVARRYFSLKIK